MRDGVVVFAREGLVESVNREFCFALSDERFIFADFGFVIKIPITFIELASDLSPWDEEGEVELGIWGGEVMDLVEEAVEIFSCEKLGGESGNGDTLVA